jgi:hypothetical protein
MCISSFSCVAEKAEMRCPIYTTQLAGVSLKIEIHISLNRRGGGDPQWFQMAKNRQK